MKPETGANHWAKVPRKVVIHRMETAECFESRVFWAIILWSWCGPQSDDAFVVKDAHGWIQREAAGNPIPGAQQDILRLLGLGPGMKGNLSRAIKRLKAKGSIRFEGRILYPVREPPIGGEAPSVVKTDNWTIAGISIRSDNFPADPVARTETVEWLTKVLSDYNNAITAARSDARQVLRQGLFDRGIITVLEKQKSREEDGQSVGPVQEPEAPEDRPTDPPEPEPEPPLPEPAPTIEEVRALIIEETARTHSEDVPGDPVCRDTVSALQGAPVERLRRAIRQKFRPTDKIGRIPYLAKDIGDRWAMERQERQKIEAEQRTREREAWEWQAENDEDEDARKVARAKLAGKSSP